MDYTPEPRPVPVVKPGEFGFSAVGLDHGHIRSMCASLIQAGASLRYVYDPDPVKVAAFIRAFPQAKVARCRDEVLDDRETLLVASAAVPADRCALGIEAMRAGKDYFVDKAPMTTLDQLEAARRAVAETGRKYAVYYSERIGTESGVYAGQLIERGAIGRVLHVTGMGPHRIGATVRPDWFYRRERYGGILIDIGSHQAEQFLYYTGAKDATVSSARIANYCHPETPELDDFGDASLAADNGASGYFRVDWLTPDGLRTWGDGRTFILGTEGTIEIRKYVNVGTEMVGGNHVFVVNRDGERYFNVSGQVGCPYFGQLILDCLRRTENAMTQEHAFKAAEISLRCQQQAVKLA